jgi:hypothetical protein
MARPKKDKADAPAETRGRNELTEAQKYSLTNQWAQDYIKLVAAKNSADQAIRGFGARAKAELGPHGLGMQDIKGLVQASTPEGMKVIKAEMERQARIMTWLNEPIGTHGQLFPDSDLRPITERAFAEGKRAGLAGETLRNPHHVTTPAHQSYSDGHHEGQSILSAGFGKLNPSAAADSLAAH